MAPLPLSLYVTAAGAVVALSGIIALALARAEAPRAVAWPRLVVPHALAAVVRTALGLLGVALFALVIVAGLIGEQSPLRNIAPTFVWVIWWVGLGFVAALLGNLWPLLNPWATLHRWLLGRVRPRLAYPEGLGSWPAVVLFTVFVWIETVWPRSEEPAVLAGVIIAYSLLTWGAMTLYGAEAWLRHGEALSVAFALFGRFAPLGAAGERSLVLRPWGAGLLGPATLSPSMTIFTALLLGSVTFDGFMETEAWMAVVDTIFETDAAFPALLGLRDMFGTAVIGIESLAMAGFPWILLGLFLAVVRIMRALLGSRDTWSLAGRLALTLMPIAIAYHLAHYLSFLAIAGQLAIPLASDPFGFGWDLFGGAGRVIDPGLFTAGNAWFVALGAIVIGHVVAVVLGHVAIEGAAASRRAANLAQLPMLALMVAYTVLSLWILAQPILART
jgi:hypothetical protein